MVSVLRYPDRTLSVVCDRVEQFDDDIKRLIDDMTEAMYVGGGVGIAAPQIGVHKRVLLIDPSGGEVAGNLVTMINPVVTWHSLEQETDGEGCLSLPGMVLQVQRSVAVDVEYSDVVGTVHSERLTGFAARIVQHEIDHLDGLTILDRVGSFTKKLALKGVGDFR